jgi:hypothetical protein
VNLTFAEDDRVLVLSGFFVAQVEKEGRCAPRIDTRFQESKAVISFLNPDSAVKPQVPAERNCGIRVE